MGATSSLDARDPPPVAESPLPGSGRRSGANPRRRRNVPWHRSLRWRLAVGYAAAVVLSTLALALYRDLANQHAADGGVLRLHGALAFERWKLPWLASPAELVEWTHRVSDEAGSASVRFRLRQIAVIDGDGVVLASTGPGAATVGRSFLEGQSEGAAKVLATAFEFQNITHTKPAGRSPDVRLRDGGGRLANGNRLAAVSFQDANGYIYGAVLRELEPTVFGNLWPLAEGVMRNAPAPILCGILISLLTVRIFVRRLEGLSDAARRWSRGDLTSRVDPGPRDEIGGLVGDLNAMAGQLGELLRAREDRAALEERNRLARDLHDAVKQKLFAATMQLGAARQRPPNSDDARNALRETESLLQSAIAELSELVTKLRPSGPAALSSAIEAETRIWSRGAGIPVRAETIEDVAATHGVSEALVRVLQEALANVARHSQATSVAVALTRENDDLVLTVRDDGCGFDGADAVAAKGFGLASMRDRMREASGRLQIETKAGEGTIVTARIPAAAARDRPVT